MIIENFHINARKVAGSVMPVSVLAAGVSSAATNNYMNNNFGSSSNSVDTSFLQPQFGGYRNKNFPFFLIDFFCF
jgi:hypothetical protein